MAQVYAPRVKETTATTGPTDPYSLDGAATGYQGFVAGVGDTNSTVYCCEDGTDWEIGYGAVTNASTDTLSRDTVLYSSNSGSAVNWGAGTKNVFCIFPPSLLGVVQGYTGFYNYTTSASPPGAGSLVVGDSCRASGATSCAVGSANVTTGDYNFVFGSSNAADYDYSYMFGRRHVSGGSSETPKYSYAFGAGTANAESLDNVVLESSESGNQYITQVSRRNRYVETTDGTITSIPLTLAPAIATTATILYHIHVVARQRAGSSGSVGDSKAWRIDVLVKYSTGTPTRIGTTAVTVIEADSNASAWTFAIDFTKAEPLRVTGATDKTIRWAAYVRGVEVGDYTS